jgi:hypothetical protein
MDTAKLSMASARAMTTAVVLCCLVLQMSRYGYGTPLFPSVWANTHVWGLAGESASVLLATISPPRIRSIDNSFTTFDLYDIILLLDLTESSMTH